MEKWALFLFVFASPFFNCLAQDSFDKTEAVANAYYQSGQYGPAIRYYEKCLEIRFSKGICRQLSWCNFYVHEYKEALKWYKEFYEDQTASTTDHLNWLMLLKYNEKYKDAKKVVVKLLKSTKNEETIRAYGELKKSCDSVLYWQRIPQKHRVLPVIRVNSIHSEVGPFPTSEGLVYSSNHESMIILPKDAINNQPYYDLLLAPRESKGFGKGMSLSARLNTSVHECMAKFNGDENELYFSRTEKDPGSKNKLLKSVKTKNGWSEPEKFRFEDSVSNNNHPFISVDGATFLFSSDRPGGYGGMDLYISFLEDSIWSDPINLGPEINSSYNEITPFLAGEYLYMSSDKPAGAGGYDVYVSELSGGDWSVPRNLRWPINSGGDDFGFVLDSGAIGTAYLASNRQSSMGMEDIFTIRYRTKP